MVDFELSRRHYVYTTNTTATVTELMTIKGIKGKLLGRARGIKSN